MDKLDVLKSSLEEMKSVLVAYSGGVDSTFLLKVSREVLGEHAVAVTAISPSFAQAELEESKAHAALIGARQIFVETRELEVDGYRENSQIGRAHV